MNLEARALALLEDGASYTETARTIGKCRNWVASRFPGRGWTKQEGGAYGYMMRKANERMELK
jgi:hypothetical protein